jgi:hypothetical protein
MSKWQCFVRILPCSLALLISGYSSARGDFITTLIPSVAAKPGGLTDYQYTLTDHGDSTLPAVEFALSVAPDANLVSLNGPVGWNITYTPGDSSVDWSSPSTATDIVPGQTAVFGFSSALGPVPLSYLIVGLDDTTGSLAINQGTIVSAGASSVPEPSTLLLCGIGLLGLVGRAGWPRNLLRRHNSTASSCGSARPAR